MSVSSSIKMALADARIKQKDLAARLGFTAPGLSNKMREESWTVPDLLRVAEMTGSKLAFVYPDGHTILIEAPKEKPADGEAE